jgi:hypothetical protein
MVRNNDKSKEDEQKAEMLQKALKDYDDDRIRLIFHSPNIPTTIKERKLDALFDTYCKKIGAVWKLFGKGDKKKKTIY